MEAAPMILPSGHYELAEVLIRTRVIGFSASISTAIKWLLLLAMMQRIPYESDEPGSAWTAHVVRMHSCSRAMPTADPKESSHAPMRRFSAVIFSADGIEKSRTRLAFKSNCTMTDHFAASRFK